MELWKPVKNFEGLYEVSNLGRVKSLYDVSRPRILKPYYSNYYQVTLVKNKIKYQRTIHSLVAEAFLKKPEGENITIDHKNGRKLDNRANNLRYVTQPENVKHSHELGLQKVLNRRKLYCAELNKEFDCAKYAAKWLMETELLTGNIDTIQRNIRHCCAGKRQTAYKYHWKFI